MVRAQETQIGLVDQISRLERLTRHLARQPPGGPFGEQSIFSRFRLGIWPDFFPGVQFSHDPAVLEKQVTRMVADPRTRKNLVDNFFSDWLQVRNVWLLNPESTRFPWFDDNLRVAFDYPGLPPLS